MTTIAEILMTCIGMLGILIVLADRGYLPTDAFGRVDAPNWMWQGLRRSHKSAGHTYAFYQDNGPMQRPFVLLMWHLRMARIRNGGRLFVIPGDGDRTTSFDQDRWSSLYGGLPITTHVLRVKHNHWRHDMTHDAIAIEFETRAAHDEFMRRVKAVGPSDVNMMDLLGPAGRTQLTGLLARNRALTEMGAR